MTRKKKDKTSKDGESKEKSKKDKSSATKKAEKSYIDHLDAETRKRYVEKLKVIGGVDPYKVDKRDWRDDVDLFPAVTYADLLIYLVHNPSPYTLESFRAYKSLEAFNNFLSGWVKELKEREMENDCCLVLSRVYHSQRLREKAVSTWITAKTEGIVVSSHCDCMAGLDETCSHVVATLFALEAHIRIRDFQTCTGEKAYWLLPNSLVQVPYKRIRELDFTSSKTMKTKLDKKISSIEDGTAEVALGKERSVKKVKIFPEPNEEELNSFFSNLNKAPSKPAILSIVPEFSDKYVPKQYGKELPVLLTELSDSTTYELPFNELLIKCKQLKKNIKVTKEQSKAASEETKDQANNKKWFLLRGGRITASKAKSAVHTDPDQPSQSLIKNICYPDAYKFSLPATSWGCEHEKAARESYCKIMAEKHSNLKVRDTGLVISTNLPFLGASPDGIVCCDCCGHGVIEVKCPYCVRNKHLEDAVKDKSFRLKEELGVIALDRTHQYYYKVQQQLQICKNEVDCCYADFVVWTPDQLFIERIMPDNTFWDSCLTKLEHFWETCILPELVGKFYKNLAKPAAVSHANTLSSVKSNVIDVNDASKSVSELNDSWCYCGGPESQDKMVCCDNENCSIQWFHFQCINMSKAPAKRKKWYCPDCRKLPEFQQRCRRRLAVQN